MLSLLLLHRPRATPAVTTSAPLIGATAVAPAPLGTPSVLRVMTPVVLIAVVVPWGLRDLGPSKAEALSARRTLSRKAALVAVAAVEVCCRQKVENQVADQDDARNRWELRMPSRPPFLANPNTSLREASARAPRAPFEDKTKGTNKALGGT